VSSRAEAWGSTRLYLKNRIRKVYDYIEDVNQTLLCHVGFSLFVDFYPNIEVLRDVLHLAVP
jgi:hypothetical protein